MFAVDVSRAHYLLVVRKGYVHMARTHSMPEPPVSGTRRRSPLRRGSALPLVGVLEQSIGLGRAPNPILGYEPSVAITKEPLETSGSAPLRGPG
jgi:hypothetical protein